MAELISTRGPRGFARWLWLSGRLVWEGHGERIELALRATVTSQLTELTASAPFEELPQRLVLSEVGARSVGFDGRLRIETPRSQLGDHGTDVLLRRPQLALDDDYVEVLERDGGEQLERFVLAPRVVDHVEDARGHRWPAADLRDPWVLRAPALVFPRAERYEVVVDHLHGIITACHAWAGSERLGGTELRDLRFDHELPQPDIVVPGPSELPAWTGWRELAVAQQAADAVQWAWLRRGDDEAPDDWPPLDELVCEAVAPPGTVAVRASAGGRPTSVTVEAEPDEDPEHLAHRVRQELRGRRS